MPSSVEMASDSSRKHMAGLDHLCRSARAKRRRSRRVTTPRRPVTTITAEGRGFLVFLSVVGCLARLLEEAVTYTSDRSLISCKAGMTSLPSSSMERITSSWAICPSFP